MRPQTSEDFSAVPQRVLRTSAASVFSHKSSKILGGKAKECRAVSCLPQGPQNSLIRIIEDGANPQSSIITPLYRGEDFEDALIAAPEGLAAHTASQLVRSLQRAPQPAPEWLAR